MKHNLILGDHHYFFSPLNNDIAELVCFIYMSSLIVNEVVHSTLSENSPTPNMKSSKSQLHNKFRYILRIFLL